MCLGSLPPSAVSPLFICISFCALFVSWLCFSVPSGRLTPCPNPAETCHAKMTTRESQGRGCFTGHLKSAAPWKRPECVRGSVSGRGWDGWMDGAFIPRAILSTLMMRMMVGLIGREASSIFSRVMPMMDSSTMTRSSWFHLRTQTHRLSKP